MKPMLATRGDRVPTGDDWVHEVKWDGIRALVEVHAGASLRQAQGPTSSARPPLSSSKGVRVWTRSERDVSLAFPELDALGELGTDLLLDGEIVQLADGVPHLSGLADRIHLTDRRRAERLAVSRPVTLLAFDLLRLGERDLMGEPWRTRRDLLEGIGLADVSWQVPEVYDDGPALLEGTRRQGLEGIVSKQVTSTYHPGTRSRGWLKFPHRPTGSFVVGGYRRETDSDRRLGALLLGQPTRDGLVYRGRVGSGLAGKAGQRLLDVLTPVDASPIPDVPRVDAVGAVWVAPEVVVDVEYLMLTADGRLRQPSYRGRRVDLTAADLEED